jgi:hypothetical protein
MSKKHIIMWVLVGWAVAYILPPQRILAYIKGGGRGGA